MTSTYSRDNLAALPTDDDTLTTTFASPADYNAVALNDGTTVDQQGNEGYALFNWEETATGNSGTFTWKGKSTKAPSESKVQLQIYKRTGTGAPVWEDVPDASDNSTAADTNFTISGTVSDLTNYKEDITDKVVLRTWQAASVAPSWLSTGWDYNAGSDLWTPGPTEGSNLLTNPSFGDPFTDGVANGWSVEGTPTCLKSTDAQDGDSSAQQFTADARNEAVKQVISTTMGKSYRFKVWGKRTTTNGTGTAYCFVEEGGVAHYIPGLLNNASYTEHKASFLAFASTSMNVRVAIEDGSSAFDTYIVDNAYFGELGQVLAVKNEGTQKAPQAGITYNGYDTAGLIARYSDSSNYCIGFLNAGYVYLGVVVAGVFTLLLAPQSVSYADNKVFKIGFPTDTDHAQLYYDGSTKGGAVDISTVTTGLPAGTYSGMYGPSANVTFYQYQVS